MESPAAGLIRSINERGEKNLPRLQMRLLVYLVDRGFVVPCFFPRTDIPALAEYLGRNTKSVEDALRALVRRGAVIEDKDSIGHPCYAFNAGWK